LGNAKITGKRKTIDINKINLSIILKSVTHIPTLCQEKFGNSISQILEVKTGLHDDNTLSPVLFFNLALEKVIRSMPLH